MLQGLFQALYVYQLVKPPQPSWVEIIVLVIVFLEIIKLRHREVKSLA